MVHALLKNAYAIFFNVRTLISLYICSLFFLPFAASLPVLRYWSHVLSWSWLPRVKIHARCTINSKETDPSSYKKQNSTFPNVFLCFLFLFYRHLQGYSKYLRRILRFIIFEAFQLHVRSSWLWYDFYRNFEYNGSDGSTNFLDDLDEHTSDERI